LISLRITGLEEAISRIGSWPARIEQATVVALNQQIVATRNEQWVEPAMAATGLSRAMLESRMPMSKATPDHRTATLGASSAGIPVTAYRWHAIPTGTHPARARIGVAWPGGEKIAAGFVNPLSRQRFPLSTRLKGRPVQQALGPSAATLVRALYGPAQKQATSEALAARLTALIDDVVADRPAPDA
jgi:hypothetical protein